MFNVNLIPNKLGVYKNGNYNVVICKDGTKYRFTEDDEFKPSFCESIDYKLTDKCDGGCKFCYEGCTINGKHGSVDYAFIDTLHPFTEIALNGNDLTHPELETFLKRLKMRQVIPNMTVNQKHFIEHYDKLMELMKNELIYGLGVSLVEVNDDLLEKIKDKENIVIHVIAGIFSEKEINELSNKNLKILILGYKKLKRGEKFYEDNSNEIERNIKYLGDNLNEVIKKFKVVSFDNLSIKQLKVKNILNDKEWEEFYMGDDGDFTFYIDGVKGVFAKNSCMPEEERFPIMNSVDEMFNFIKNKYKL